MLNRIVTTLLLLLAAPAFAAGMLPTPPRAEGEGPFPRLVIRGVTIIQGDGSPPYGPADIIVEGNRIADIRSAGTPGLPMKPDREPKGAHEIDATGMFVLPGFVDMHGHMGDPDKAPDPMYPYRLWLAHGVTTVRGVPFFDGDVDRALDDKRRSAADAITAPRLYVYQTLGSGWARGRVDTPGQGPRLGEMGGGEGRRRHQVLQPRRRDRRDHQGRHRRGEAPRHGHRRPSVAARHRDLERPRRGGGGTWHRHPLLRPFRIAAQGPPAAGLSGGL